MVDGADLVTIEDITDPGVEDVVVLGEGDVLSDDEGDRDSDAAEYNALGDGALPRSLGNGEATEYEDLRGDDGNVAVASDDAVGDVAAVSAGHSVLQL